MGFSLGPVLTVKLLFSSSDLISSSRISVEMPFSTIFRVQSSGRLLVKNRVLSLWKNRWRTLNISWSSVLI